jgi:putative hydrolase of the HAD superfamily
MRPEIILLDCGGTITWPPFDRLATTVRGLKGIELPVETQCRAFHRGSHALEDWQRTNLALPAASPLELSVWIFNAGLAAEGFPGAWDLACGQAMTERGERPGNWDYTFPWVKPCLERLKRAGYRLALVSNADGHVLQMINRLGYAPYFEAVIDSCVVGVAKPDPQIFYLALKALGLEEYVLMAKAAADGQGIRPPVLFVGDSFRNDFTGATQAGLHARLLDPLGLYAEWTPQRTTDLRTLTDELT